MPSCPFARLLLAALAALVLAATATAQTGAVQRCESKDGRVTYSNTACPEGTLPVRKVNTEPPVSVDAKKAAEERARKESAALQQIDKGKAQQEAHDRKQADERAKADAKAKERCERTRRELERAQATRADLNAGPLSVEKMQKADRDVGRREAEVAKECAR
jgi:hypothetical protein